TDHFEVQVIEPGQMRIDHARRDGIVLGSGRIAITTREDPAVVTTNRGLIVVHAHSRVEVKGSEWIVKVAAFTGRASAEWNGAEAPIEVRDGMIVVNGSNPRDASQDPRERPVRAPQRTREPQRSLEAEQAQSNTSMAKTHPSAVGRESQLLT